MAKPSENPGGKIRFAEFELDLRRGELRKHGIRIRVQEQPLKILTALLEQPGEVVTREELRKRVWGEETFVEFDHGLNAAVNRLREALCDSAEEPRYVETVARRGYRCIAEVEGAGHPELEAPTPPEPPKRPPWAIWGTAALALAVLAGFGIWSLNRDARQEPIKVVPLTTDLGNEYSPSFSPDGKQVAYSWTGEQDDNYDIYVKVVGSAVRPLRLTTGPARDNHPVWSPDGRTIAFVRRDGHLESVHLISPLGGGERKLADVRLSLAPNLSWAPNGKVLAISEIEPQGVSGLFAWDVQSGEKWRLTSNQRFWDRGPAFSPDGRLLAYCSASGLYSNNDLFVLPLDSGFRPQGKPRRLTNQGFAAAGVAWAADGESLIYSASIEALENYRLWRVAVSGKNQPERLEAVDATATFPAVSAAGNRLAFTRGGFDTDLVRWRPGEKASPFLSSTMMEDHPKYSPDGSRIVFSSARSGEGRAIWICDQDGSNLGQLTNKFSRFQGSPFWSPDGRFVVFDALGSDGHWDIYRVPSSGGKEQRLTAGGSDNSSPTYSRDGRWIYFSSDRSGRSEIWRMPAGGGEAIQVTRGGGYYALESWDGKTLYRNGAAAAGGAFLTPLIARSLADGVEKPILDQVASRRFVPVEDGIYYIGPEIQEGQYPLLFLDFATGKSRLLTRIEGPTAIGLTVAPDRKTFIFSARRDLGYDLMMIENFR